MCFKRCFKSFFGPFQHKKAVEASYAKATQAIAIKHNPLLLFFHTFGLNTAFDNATLRLA